ncbi:hypothetical protein JB92DRAFT_3115011 [Gautieria morchelliformis]|nr:hypothetical protein JB92DRAFT_3115011 [Gautieria morchelliformis]
MLYNLIPGGRLTRCLSGDSLFSSSVLTLPQVLLLFPLLLSRKPNCKSFITTSDTAYIEIIKPVVSHLEKAAIPPVYQFQQESKAIALKPHQKHSTFKCAMIMITTILIITTFIFELMEFIWNSLDTVKGIRKPLLNQSA